MSSTGPPPPNGESTASRLDRIARQQRRYEGSDDHGGDGEDPVEQPETFDESAEAVVDEESIVSSSMQGDPDVTEENVPDAVDPEQDGVEDHDEVRNSASGVMQREPSNFSVVFRSNKALPDIHIYLMSFSAMVPERQTADEREFGCFRSSEP